MISEPTGRIELHLIILTKEVNKWLFVVLVVDADLLSSVRVVVLVVSVLMALAVAESVCNLLGAYEGPLSFGVENAVYNAIFNENGFR